LGAPPGEAPRLGAHLELLEHQIQQLPIMAIALYRPVHRLLQRLHGDASRELLRPEAA
jgi:hypothetical protein